MYRYTILVIIYCYIMKIYACFDASNMVRQVYIDANVLDYKWYIISTYRYKRLFEHNIHVITEIYIYYTS